MSHSDTGRLNAALVRIFVRAAARGRQLRLERQALDSVGRLDQNGTQPVNCGMTPNENQEAQDNFSFSPTSGGKRR